MPDDLPAPIGPDIEKIIARLYPPLVQDLVETSERLLHKRITHIQLAIRSFLEARLRQEMGTGYYHTEDAHGQEALLRLLHRLLRWAGTMKMQEQRMIAAQQEGHRERLRSILAWWDARAPEED